MKEYRLLIALAFFGLFLAATLSASEPAQTSADPARFQFFDRLVALMLMAGAPGGGAVDIG
jgi:hypothetical protein